MIVSVRLPGRSIPGNIDLEALEVAGRASFRQFVAVLTPTSSAKPIGPRKATTGSHGG